MHISHGSMAYWSQIHLNVWQKWKQQCAKNLTKLKLIKAIANQTFSKQIYPCLTPIQSLGPPNQSAAFSSLSDIPKAQIPDVDLGNVSVMLRGLLQFRFKNNREHSFMFVEKNILTVANYLKSKNLPNTTSVGTDKSLLTL